MSLNGIKVGLTILKDQPLIQSSGVGVWLGRSIRPIGQALLLKNPVVLTVAFVALTILTISFIVYQYQKNKFLENEIANVKENSRLEIEDLKTKFLQLSDNSQKEHYPNEQPLPLPLFVEIKNELEAAKQEEKKIEFTELPHPSILFASINNAPTNKKETLTTTPLTSSRTNSAVEEEKIPTLSLLAGITQGRLGLKPAGERKTKETNKEPSLTDNLNAHPLLINANQNKTDHLGNGNFENDEVNNEKLLATSDLPPELNIINEIKQDDLPPSDLPPELIIINEKEDDKSQYDLPNSDLQPVLSVQEKIAKTIREAKLKKAREAEEAEQILRDMGL